MLRDFAFYVWKFTKQLSFMKQILNSEKLAEAFVKNNDQI